MNPIDELRKKYWDGETDSCTWKQFLDAITEAREIGFNEAKEIFKGEGNKLTLPWR